MHDGMPYGRNQGQGQGHSREVDGQSPTGLIFYITLALSFRDIRLPMCYDIENRVRGPSRSLKSHYSIDRI